MKNYAWSLLMSFNSCILSSFLVTKVKIEYRCSEQTYSNVQNYTIMNLGVFSLYIFIPLFLHYFEL